MSHFYIKIATARLVSLAFVFAVFLHVVVDSDSMQQPTLILHTNIMNHDIRGESNFFSRPSSFSAKFAVTASFFCNFSDITFDSNLIVIFQYF